MREITDVRELQMMQLEILKYIDQLCKKHKLKYYLFSGTLLGAIRHKGFIPWDDDLDICMPRPDFIKLIKIMRKHSNRNYSLKCVELSKKEYNYCFAKMIDNNTVAVEVDKFQGDDLGIWVDIFPLDGAGNNFEEAEAFAYKNKRYVKQILGLEAGRKMNIKGKILYLIGRKGINRLLMHNVKRKNFYNCKYVMDIVSTCPPVIFNGDSFQGERTEMFEGIEFNVPNNAEDVLETIFGNYLELPPEEERKPHHGCKIWINE